MPAAVGVDIGCGMIAVKTQYTSQDIGELVGDYGKTLTELRTSIERAILLSAGAYNRKLTETAKARVTVLGEQAEIFGFDPAKYVVNWRLQLGTLGSGNHFIE